MTYCVARTRLLQKTFPRTAADAFDREHRRIGDADAGIGRSRGSSSSATAPAPAQGMAAENSECEVVE